jgi:uncharacterized protein YoxC
MPPKDKSELLKTLLLPILVTILLGIISTFFIGKLNTIDNTLVTIQVSIAKIEKDVAGLKEDTSGIINTQGKFVIDNGDNKIKINIIETEIKYIKELLKR